MVNKLANFFSFNNISFPCLRKLECSSSKERLQWDSLIILLSGMGFFTKKHRPTWFPPFYSTPIQWCIVLLMVCSPREGVSQVTQWESDCQCRRRKRLRFEPWVRNFPWRRKWQPAPVFLPGKFQGQRSLAGYSSWGCRELDTTEHTWS